MCYRCLLSNVQLNLCVDLKPEGNRPLMNTKSKTLRLLNNAESGDGGDSGSSTPSEEYKTPTFEIVSLPGSSCLFDFPQRPSCASVQKDFTILHQNSSFVASHSANALPMQPLDGVAACNTLKSPTENVSMFNVQTSAQENTWPSSVNQKLVRSVDHYASRTVLSHNVDAEFSVPQASMMMHLSSNDSKTAALASSVAPLESSLCVSRPAGKKTATFAPLPNQTTWMRERVFRSASDCDVVACMANNETVPSSQLVEIKMRLEERRHQIESEKRRMTAQWKRHRQQVGNDGVVQVVSKSQPSADFLVPEGVVPIELSDSGVELERQAVETMVEFEQNSQQKSTPSLEQNGQQCASFVSFTPRACRAATAFSESVHVSRPAGCQSAIKSSSASTISSSATNVVGLDKDRLLPSVTTSAIKDHGSGMPATASRERVSDYGTSLDRLNSSLMELQGEIMRLSLQQDQIKSLVGPDTDSSLDSAASAVNSSQFYLSQTAENHTVDSLLGTSYQTIGRPVDTRYLPMGYMPCQQYSNMSSETRQQAGVTDSSYCLFPCSYVPAASSPFSQLDGLFRQSDRQHYESKTVQSRDVIDVSQSLPVYTISATIASSACSSPTPISSSCSSLNTSFVCSPAAICSSFQPDDKQSYVSKSAVALEASTVNYHTASVPNIASNEAFFMTFDDVTPRRPKPVLGLARNARSKLCSEVKTLSPEVLDHPEWDYVTKKAENCESRRILAVSPVATAVGFNIVHSEIANETVGEFAKLCDF